MFFGRADIAHDTHEAICAFLCAEAAGDLFLYLGESDAAFGFIIGERYSPIYGESENVGFIVSEPFQKAPGFAFRLAAALAFRRFLYGIGCKAFGHQSVISSEI